MMMQICLITEQKKQKTVNTSESPLTYTVSLAVSFHC